MTNDTTTLNGALSELGETMADNLVAMGVLDATASDGLTTLAGKILLVEPSISGLDLDTAVTLSASNESISLGSSVVLTSKLTASYDDETLVDVDLNGVLTGATILFKEGSTTIGSGVTDSNGIVTATISNLSAGSHIIKAVFEGTANFNACESSSITVVVSAVDSVTLVSDKNILSYVDGDTAVLTATLTGVGVAGKTVSFDIVDEGVVVENIGTATTDSSGICSVEYQSKDANDIYIKASCNNIESSSVLIEDCHKYDSTTHSVTTGTSLYVNAFEELSESTDYDISANFTSTLGDNFHISFASTPRDEEGAGGGIFIQSNSFKKTSTGTPYISSFSSPFTIRWVREGTTLSIYLNGTLVDTIISNDIVTCKYLRLVSWSNNKTITWTNLKIKSL